MKCSCFTIFKNKLSFQLWGSGNKGFTLQKIMSNMKKSITIPQVEIELYDAAKERCKREGKSLSDYFNSLLGGQSEEKASELESLREELSEVKAAFAEQEGRYREELQELEEKFTAKDAELERVSIELADERRNHSAHSVIVELSPLEFALIKHVSLKESRKQKKEITPGLLLKSMFGEYCIKGETWFFDFPTRGEIRSLQRGLEEQGEEEVGDE